MADDAPKILARTHLAVSPWMDVITREVQFSDASPVASYYAIAQPDFIVVLAMTEDERIPLVRQYRPAIERYSLELPAGLLDPNEEPPAAAARELLEETGYPADRIELIGKGATCSSRISNTTHSFFIRTGKRRSDFTEEAGVSVSLVSRDELRALMLSGEFAEQTHLGVLALAAAKGLLNF